MTAAELKHHAKVGEWMLLPERFVKSNTPDLDELLPWSETMRQAHTLV